MPLANELAQLERIRGLDHLGDNWDRYKDTDLDALFAKYFTEPYPEVFLDSGAFSADTVGPRGWAWRRTVKH